MRLDKEGFIQKEFWGKGPWNNESDRYEWIDDVTGYPCLAKRNVLIGSWCGYVGVYQGHKLHGKTYSEIEEEEYEMEIHGGLTYSEESSDDFENGVCSKLDNNNTIWWLGFDCAHYNDIVPSLTYNTPKATYKDLDFVKAECEKLAKQLKDADKLL